MVNFCKSNPEAVVALLSLAGTLITFLAVTIIGLIKGWWKHSEHGNEALWLELKEIKDRQLTLRTTLPLEYVRVTALDELKKTWRDLAQELRDFMNSCREGNCFAGKMMKNQGIRER